MADDQSASKPGDTAGEPHDEEVTEVASVSSGEEPPPNGGGDLASAGGEASTGGASAGEAASGGDEPSGEPSERVDPDATAPMSLSELDDEPGAVDPDATAPMPVPDAVSASSGVEKSSGDEPSGEPSESVDPDATAPMSLSELEADEPVEDADATAIVPPDDATQLIQPGDDATTVLPTAERPTAPIRSEPQDNQPTTVLRPQVPDATSVMPPAGGSARWSAKANVPVIPREPDETDQWSPAEPGRAWWLPILLAIIGLLVLLGIAYALITSVNNNKQPTTPGPTVPTPSATPSPTQASTPPTSAPASTPPTTAGAPYTVPASLIGLQVADAQSILDSAKIAYVAVPQTDNTDFPNTVVRTDPSPGQTVPPGGTVTLYYAQPSLTSPASTPTTATPSPSASASGG